MPLAPGTSLGRYQITALIGKGGMGEVYRAHDPQVKREVAIKVSFTQFSERFHREAEAVAALNHPNICTLYDVGPNYLVMEFIEGPTLGERLKDGALGVEEAFGIARQIAAALEHAHDKAVVHRDLKPANVKIRPDGTVKVLDFGLAKVGRTSTSGSAPGEESPTLTMGLTESGVIMGTASYMSPEQAKGLQVDKRADIWAFGMVLHEMLTGRRTFRGETVSDILAQVILKDPEWDRVPEAARPLLRWCLEKDPGKRLRDIGDVFRLMESGAGSPSLDANQAGSLPHKGHWAGWAVAAVMAMAVGVAIWAPWRVPAEMSLRSASLLPPENAVFDFQSQFTLPAISPDGRRIVFGARGNNGKDPVQLWVRSLDSPSAQPLPGTEGGSMPFWSPDSRWVGFGTTGGENKLKKIDIQGGPPVLLSDLPTAMRGASWSPEGVIVLGLNTNSPMMRVSSAGGALTPATKLEEGKEAAHRFPWFLPDGKHFLYVVPAMATEPNKIKVNSLDQPDSPGTVVTEAESTIAYAQGHLLFLRGSTLMAQPFDPGGPRPTGEAKPIAERIPTYMSPSRLAGFTVSANGLLVYHGAYSAAGRTRLAWVDRQGKQISVLGEPVWGFQSIELSPDQKSLLGSIRDTFGRGELWIWELARGLKQRFTFEGNNPEGMWSPDGATIVWRSRNLAKGTLFRRPSNGTGAAEPLYSDANSYWPTSWSPDGKTLLVWNTTPDPKTKGDIWALPLDAGQPGGAVKPRAFLQTPFVEQHARFSPDGKWVAYASDESGRFEVYVLPYPGPGGKRQVSNGGGWFPRWRRDGRELYYVSREGQLMAAEVSVRQGSFEVGQIKPLFGGLNSIRGYLYDLSADGQKFILPTEGGQDGDPAAPATPPLTLVENWPALIKK